jgi:hypothetical protein
MRGAVRPLSSIPFVPGVSVVLQLTVSVVFSSQIKLWTAPDVIPSRNLINFAIWRYRTVTVTVKATNELSFNGFNIVA